METEAQRTASSSWEKAPFVLEADSTALIIVDMQYATASRTEGWGKHPEEVARERGQTDALEYRFDRIEKVAVPNIQRLLDFFRKHQLRVIYLTNGAAMSDYSDCPPHRRRRYAAARSAKGNREHEILDEIKPLPGECVINKTTSSAFNSTNIDQVLSRAMGINYLVFTGVSTDRCVENTARDAVDLGYQCIMVEDGCASANEVFHNNTLMHFRAGFGRVETTEAVIAELATALFGRTPSAVAAGKSEFSGKTRN
ncbi:MAG: cysteine hydrolase [Chloroflexi bacterium]|nr:cysteine hydrolase [Chloroflexota bacterium]